jgi:hypothetical protein
MPNGFTGDDVGSDVAAAGAVGKFVDVDEGDGDGTEGCVQAIARTKTAVTRRIKRVCG